MPKPSAMPFAPLPSSTILTATRSPAPKSVSRKCRGLRVLSDPSKRAAYDAGGFAAAGVPPEDLFAGIDFDELFRGAGFCFGDDFFERFFRRRRRGPARGEDLEIATEVPLDKIARGGEETVRSSRPTRCSAWPGSGAAVGTAPKNRDACHGSGQHVTSRQDGGMVVQYVTECSACHGAGTIIEKPCSECRGRGKLERVETLEVKIPVGAEEGTVLRIAGHGLPSRDATGTAGDLLVTVYTKPDPRFARHGADLWHTARLRVPDAALGSTLDVPTLDGTASVKVPAGTQPDWVPRLSGKGYRDSEQGLAVPCWSDWRCKSPLKNANPMKVCEICPRK